jgi:hypothetical protein
VLINDAYQKDLIFFTTKRKKEAQSTQSLVGGEIY